MNRFVNYVSQSWTELTKVVWPTRKVAIRLSIVVVIFSIIMAIFLGAMDYLFTQVLQKLILKG